MARRFSGFSVFILFAFIFFMANTPARATNVADLVEQHEEFSRSFKSGHEAKLIDKVLDAQAFCNEKNFVKFKAELVRYLEASVNVLRDALPQTALAVAGLLTHAKSLRFQKPCHPHGEGLFIHAGLPGAGPEGSRVPRSDQLRLRLAILACDKDEFERQRSRVLKELEALKSRLIKEAKAGACPKGKGKCDTDEIDKVSMEIKGIKGMKGPTSPPCGKKGQQQAASGDKTQQITPGTGGGQKQTSSGTAESGQSASEQGETEEGYWQYCRDGKNICTASPRVRKRFEDYIKKHGVPPKGISRKWIKGPPPPNWRRADTPKAQPKPGKKKPVKIGASVTHENKCRVGRSCKFSFEFINLSDVTITGPLIIYDWMPVPVTVIYNSKNWFCAPAKSGKVMCATNVDNLAPGASLPLELRVGVRRNFPKINASNCVEVPNLTGLTNNLTGSALFETPQDPFFFPINVNVGRAVEEDLFEYESLTKDSVELLQFGAKVEGYDPGPIDGKAGPKSRRAINRALQKGNNSASQKRGGLLDQIDAEYQAKFMDSLFGDDFVFQVPFRACTPINIASPPSRITRGQPPRNQQGHPSARNPNIQIDLGIGIGGRQRNNQNWQHQNRNPAGIGIQISDQRLKRDIMPVAKLESGLTLYRWKYLWSETVYVGVLAQDLLAKPKWRGLVKNISGGWFAVDYSRLGFPMMRYEEWRHITGFDTGKL